jgi:hypothetical protein
VGVEPSRVKMGSLPKREGSMKLEELEISCARETWSAWLRDQAKRYRFNSRKHLCIFCGEPHQLTTGCLPLIGSIWKCADCSDLYHHLRGLFHESIA